MIGYELDELCECEIETSRLNPILDPLTIIANIIKRDDTDDIEIVFIMIVNIDIINNSNLRSIRIIFFRHQHNLAVLIIIMSIIILIIEYSTSKVDVLVKLFRTFDNINYLTRNIFCRKNAAYIYN